MANTLVRFLGGPAGLGGPVGKRASHRLSDGTLVMVVADANRSGVSGAAGDNSNTQKLYIYSSPDATTWTLKATLATTITSASSILGYSSVVDSADSVHIVWIDGGAAVKWVKATYSAGAFTLGAAVTVYTSASNFVASRVDIDCFSTTQPIIAVYTQSTIGTGAALGAKAYAFLLSTTGTVLYTKSIQILSGVNAKAYSDDITITATHETVSSNKGSWMMIASAQPASGVDSGDYLWVGQVNTNTGAEINFLTDSAIPLSGKQYRKYMLFCADGSKELVYGVITAGTGAVYGYRRMNITSAGAVTYQSSLATTALSGYVPDAPGVNGYITATMQYVDNTYCAMTYAFTQADTNCFNVTAQTKTGVFRANALTLDQGISLTANAVGCVSGGNNRNFNRAQINFLIHYYAHVYQARCVFPSLPNAPANVIPSSGATVQTALPSVGADFKLPYSTPSGVVQQFYYIAKDAGLTTSRKSILSPNLYTPQFTDVAHGLKVSDLYSPTDLSLELTQGVWYIGAYTYDEWQRFSVVSAVTSFTVSHPPSGANLHPTGGQILSYGAGTVTLAWAFTDPYINDHQSAFQAQIQTTAGASVYDSGKVTSSSGSVNVAVSSTYKDVQLQWRVMLWDKDGVAGAFSGWQVFYVSDPPVVTVTSPTPAQVFTTGIPVITFTNGIGGSKSQASYAVQIYDGVTGQSVYYALVSGTALSHTLPTGVIHNAKSYTVVVTVTDTLGLSSSSVPVGFTTSWTPPAAADIVRVYLYRYISDGYVFIGWSNLNYDSRFVAWNLYRRAVGDSLWELINSTSDVQLTYGYRDYDVKAGKLYQYAITQVVNVLGDQIESVLAPGAQVSIPSASYWLIDSLGIFDSVPIFSVTADKYTNEQDSATYTVVGLGRVVDEGDILGVNGSMTIEVRDKATGLVASINQFLNPAMQAATFVNQPDNWTIAGTGSFGAISTDYYTFYEPAPNGELINFVMRASALGNGSGDALTISQLITSDRLPCVPGSTFSHTEWYAVEPVVGNVLSLPTVKSKVTYYNSANAVISTETISANRVDTYEPSSSGDLNTGSWARYEALHNMPLLTDHMTVQTVIQSTVSGGYGLITGGSQLEAKTTPYFDGNSRGANWTGAANASSSYTSGYYTATNQLEDIQTIKNIGRPLYLKTPFGQSFYVKLPNNDFDRMAGVTAEFGTMTLPYIEVAF